jgi:mono/diheme cytochrome c family protein
MAEVESDQFSGGNFQDRVAAQKIRRWSAVNLTPAKSGLANWSSDNLSKYLQTGVSARAVTFGPMNEVVSNSLRYLSAVDVAAMTTYLKSLPERESSTNESRIDSQVGATRYKEHCEQCHLASGHGGIFNGPPLAGSAVVQTEDPASFINIVLYGAETPPEVSLGAWETMKPYADVLTDADIAAICNYVRTSWGNRGRIVTTLDVAAQR